MNTQPNSSTTRRMGRRFHAKRFVVVMTLLVLVVGYFIIAPLLVRNAIRKALHEYGEDVVAFELMGLSPTSARLTDIALGNPQWLTGREARLTYTPLSLWRGRVKSVTIDGVEWTIRQRDGEFDFGLKPPPSDSSSEFDVPFDSLAVTNSNVHLESDGQLQSIAASASINRTSAGRLDAQVDLTAPRVAQQGVSVADARVSVQAAIATLAGQLTVEGLVDVKAWSVDSPSNTASVMDFAATVPFAYGSTPTDAGRIRTGPISVRDVELPGIAGTMSIAQTRVRTDLTWPITADATVQSSAWLDFGNDGLRGNVNATVPAFELVDASLVTALVPQLEGVTIGGRYAADAVISIDGANITPRITITGERMTVQKSDWPGSIDDAETQITINSFQPLATEPGQVFIINRATIGEVDVTDASFGFTLESPQRLNMLHASWHMAGSAKLGRFTLDPFVVDAASPRFKSILHCDEVGLGPWLELLTSDRVTANGTLSGLINFAFDSRMAQMVTLGNGVLEARPPRGTIRIKDEALARELLEQIDVGNQKYVVQVRDRIVSALQDFEYSALSVEFSPEEGDYVCELRTAGRGRIGPDPQEFAGIEVSIHHFNALVRDAVIGRNLYERIRE